MINLFSPQNDEEKQWRKFFMKSTGIVRKVDELGRIVLPIELRRTMDIAEKDAIEIYVDGASIILRKYEPTWHLLRRCEERHQLPRKEHLPELPEGNEEAVSPVKKRPPDLRRAFSYLSLPGRHTAPRAEFRARRSAADGKSCKAISNRFQTGVKVFAKQDHRARCAPCRSPSRPA